MGGMPGSTQGGFFDLGYDDGFIAWMTANETMNGSAFLAPKKKAKRLVVKKRAKTQAVATGFEGCQSVRGPPRPLRRADLVRPIRGRWKKGITDTNGTRLFATAIGQNRIGKSRPPWDKDW